MHKNTSKLEIFVDSLIPLAIILIIIITIAEVFFKKFIQPYYYIVDIIDLVIIFIFVLDLGFKYRHAKNIPDFLRRYWIYIIAVFPFFLVFRLIERFYRISTLSSGTTVILGRYVITLVNETRIARFAELFRFLGVSARLVRAFYFYEHPKVRHKINITKLLGLKKEETIT
ncbi:MAG: hypothetical protein KQA38_00470 [Candidatus Aenigmarchaeota archaeon]|nr:hypothetical protein [Candidatus Aenigmarchaeota archaeon]